MSLDIAQIAETFCSWKFAETYPYMVDEIKWNIIGRAELSGRKAVIERCARARNSLRLSHLPFQS